MNAFPSHNIDPRKKDKDWCLQFAKAAWDDSSNAQPKKMFYHYASQYDKIKSYALGRQDTSIYKKAMHIDEQSNTTFAVLDFKVLPILKKHRQIALGRLQKTEYNIVATPIDAMARNDADKYFAEVKAKIMMRDALKQQNPELAESPMLKPEAGEPLDMEELEMQMDFGYKHNYAIEAEEGIQLIFNQNDMTRLRHKIFEDLFDNGVGIYKDWMEPSGKVRCRRCDPRSIVTNYCHYEDFSDLLYCGEVMTISWNDFREQADGQFDEQQFEQIFEASKKQVEGNPSISYRTRVDDKFKVKVLDLEWFSVDEQVYEDRVNRLGNQVFGKTDYSAKNNVKSKIKRYKQKVVYKGKWIVGTNFIYDCGLASYMKRDRNLSNTELSYHIVAMNFMDMSASGIMEDLIPIADQVQISWLKLQNIRNQLIPFGFDIDLDAIEDVPLGKGRGAVNP
jgi:hypothetical protein